VLLERVVATIDRDERQAVALLACAGGGDGPLERDVAVKLQAATRGAHGAELRCALLDFLVSRADRDSIEPTLVELVRTETDPAVRTRAVRDLASVASPDDPAVATLVRATEDRDSAVRAAAVVGLAPLSSDETALGAVLDATARETDSAAKRQMAAALRIAHPELTFPTTDERGPP
ncbi:MAG TPA: HEAT repeat domain-containing protein, partial [Planctomycetota bacterium]|nr:HEAT repeat domain-containing protein [Planctomycetota bacterium]